MDKRKVLAVIGALLAFWGGVTGPLDSISLAHLAALIIGALIFSSAVVKI